jgi:hypothetical protein
VLFGPIEGRWRWHPVKKKFQKIIFLSPPWVAVLKLWNNFFWFPTEKKKFLRLLLGVQISTTNHCLFLTGKCAIPENVPFSVFGIRKIINSLPLRVRSNKALQVKLPTIQSELRNFTNYYFGTIPIHETKLWLWLPPHGIFRYDVTELHAWCCLAGGYCAFAF